MFHEESLCLECEGEQLCIPVIELPGGGGDCQTVGECIVKIACTIILTCFQCERDDENAEIVATVTRETCVNCYNY